MLPSLKIKSIIIKHCKHLQTLWDSTIPKGEIYKRFKRFEFELKESSLVQVNTPQRYFKAQDMTLELY